MAHSPEGESAPSWWLWAALCMCEHERVVGWWFCLDSHLEVDSEFPQKFGTVSSPVSPTAVSGSLQFSVSATSWPAVTLFRTAENLSLVTIVT